VEFVLVDVGPVKGLPLDCTAHTVSPHTARTRRQSKNKERKKESESGTALNLGMGQLGLLEAEHVGLLFPAIRTLEGGVLCQRLESAKSENEEEKSEDGGGGGT
jgi:hypothetical protein